MNTKEKLNEKGGRPKIIKQLERGRKQGMRCTVMMQDIPLIAPGLVKRCCADNSPYICPCPHLPKPFPLCLTAD